MLEWCESHKWVESPLNDDNEITRERMSNMDDVTHEFMHYDQELLFEIILVRVLSTLAAKSRKFRANVLQAANYLDIKPLLDVGCKTVANMIKGKTPEEIRKTFNIQCDFTPDEEDQIRRENEWAEE